MAKKLLLLAFILLFSHVGVLFPLDFGGVLSQNLELGNSGADADRLDIAYVPKISPWASLPLRNNLFLYLSASLAGRYESETWKPLFEVDRFEISWQPRPRVAVQAGRFAHADPLGLIAVGLFDGAAASLGLGKTRLSLGAYYTGLLYKGTARIAMTNSDLLEYMDGDHYWAPPRLFASLLYTLPGLISPRGSLVAGLILQFDLRAGDQARLHTQYGSLQYLWNPLDVLTLNLGGIFSLAQAEGADPVYSYALSLRGDWTPPSALGSQLSLLFRYASGLADNNEAQGAFTPITDVSQSGVFGVDFSGIMAVSGIYTHRLLEGLSLTGETRFLMRADLTTFSDEALDPGSRSHVLGLELDASLIWVPFSDLGLSAGGGVFFPLPGSAFYDDAPPKWNLSLNAMLSF